MKKRRFLAMLLSIVMIITSVDFPAFASQMQVDSKETTMQQEVLGQTDADQAEEKNASEEAETEKQAESGTSVQIAAAAEETAGKEETAAAEETSVAEETAEKEKSVQETVESTTVPLEKEITGKKADESMNTSEENQEENGKIQKESSVQAADTKISYDALDAGNSPQVLSESDELSGDGTEQSPYLIYTEEDLKLLSDKSQSAKVTSWFRLENSIELTSENWIPIGNSSYPFSGVFDGEGYTISGLVINNQDASYTGLFGYNAGTIRNLNVEGSITGNCAYLGGIAGQNNKTIENCGSNVAVNNTGSNYCYTGSLAGYNNGTINNSYARGRVTSSARTYYTGGLAGYNNGTLRKCYASGTVNGGEGSGLTGTGNGNIKACYYYDGNTNIVAGYGASASKMKQQSCYYGWDFDNIWEMEENGYPVLNIRGEEKKVSLEGSGTAAEPYLITNEEELFALALGELPLNKVYQLENDIELTSWNWTPIGGNGRSYFSGTFDGNGHRISGLKIENTTYGESGLFGYNEGKIRNLTVEGSISGADNNQGGLTGQNRGTIENCGSDVSVNNTGSDYRLSGGLAGYNSGTINNSYARGKVTSTARADRTGGLVGYNDGTLRKCYTSGLVNGGEGSGLTGTANGNIKSCYYYSANTRSSAGYGTSVSRMKQQSCYYGWDFDNIWEMEENGYPVLNVRGEEKKVSPEGSGTAAEPYLITNEAELFTLALGELPLNKVYQLENDIELTSWNWIPIGGNGRSYFSGTFDGNGHRISGLQFSSTTYGEAGLFGYNEGKIRNLTVEGSISGADNNQGGLAGQNRGTIENCGSNVTVNNTGSDYRLSGSLVGYNGGTINNSYARGKVASTARADRTGGLVGYNDGTLRKCYASGLVNGGEGSGLTGNSNGNIKACYFYNANTRNSVGYGASASRMKQQSCYYGWDFDNIWKMEENGYPVLNIRGEEKKASPEGSGTAAEPYLVTDEDELFALALGELPLNKVYQLENDITLTSWNWTPIGGNGRSNFSGTFNGNGHRISGLVINDVGYDYAGLFGYNEGKIRNLTVEGSISGYGYNVGGLAGQNGGTIENCGSRVTVNHTGSDYRNAGGLAGYNNGTVNNSYARGKVTSTARADRTGGLIGCNDGTLRKCYASGLVNGGEGSGLTGNGSGNIKACYYYSGNTRSSVGYGANTSRMKQQSCYYGWDFDNIWEMETNGYPKLNVRGEERTVTLEGNGTAAEPYLITNEEELFALALGELPLNKVYQLENDIELTSWNWTPIGGNGRSYFSGTFNGNGHRISGLILNDVGYEYAGLFGYNEGKIRNLTVEGSISGYGYNLGGLAGQNHGTIENCGSRVTVNHTGSDYRNAGGLAGYNRGTINNSYSRGKVTSTARADRTGGLVGCNEGTLRKCYASGLVNGGDGSGLTGNSSGNIKACYYYNGNARVVVGFGVSTSRMKQQSSYYGWDFDNIWEMEENSYPVLNIRGAEKKAVPEGSGTEAEPYLITNEEELFALALGELSLSKVYRLENDIELTSWNWTPIGGNGRDNFSGTFDGNGHRISGLSVKDFNGTYAGFFGYSSGTIKNLIVEGSISGSNNHIGGLAGYTQGTVQNCGVNVSINNSGTNYVYTGGLAGEAGGTVTNSYSRGKVTSGYTYCTGGLIGINSSSVTNCYSTGAVSSGAGGLIGRNSGTVTGSWYCSTTSGSTDTGKGEPLTKAQMKTESSFEGWDFINTWSIYSTVNDGYPFLLCSAGSMEESNDSFWYEVTEYKKGYAAYDQIMKIFLRPEEETEVDQVTLHLDYIENGTKKSVDISTVYDKDSKAYMGTFNIKKGISEVSAVSATAKQGSETSESRFVSSFWYQMPLKVEGTATVKLPEEVADSEDMLLKLFTDDNVCVYKQKMDGQRSIVIHALASDNKYRAVLYGNNMEFASQDNISVIQGNNIDVDFTRISQIADMNVEFYSEGTRVVNSGIKAIFYDKTPGKNRLLGSGNSLAYLSEGDVIGYSASMDSSASRLYRLDSTVYEKTLSAGDNTVKIELKPFKDINIKGTVMDPDTNNPVTGVKITATQKLNGIHSNSKSVTSDSNGEFSLSMSDEPVTFSISKNGYITSTQTISADKLSAGIILKLQKAKGRIEFNVSYMESIPDSESDEIITYNVLPDKISLYNTSTGKEITDFANSWPVIFADSSMLRSGNQVEATITKKGYATTVLKGTVNSSGNIKFSGKVYQLGGLKCAISRSDGLSGNINQVMVYDAAGEKVYYKNSAGSSFALNDLADGTYTVVAADRSVALPAYTTFSDLEDETELSGTYAMQEISVQKGVISQGDEMEVPSAEKQITLLDQNKSSVVANTSIVMIGDTLNVKAEYVITDFNDADNVKAVVNIPAGTKLADSTITVNGVEKAVAANSENISVNVKNSNTVIRYRVKVLKTVSVSVLGFVGKLTYALSGKSYTEIAGRTDVELSELTLAVPEQTSYQEIIVRGIAEKNTDINIYDDGILVGQATANKYGVYRAEVTLVDKGINTRHHIQAKNTDTKAESAIAEVIYGRLKATVTSFVLTHNGKKYDLNDPSKEVSSFTMSMVPSRPYEFAVKFDDNTAVDFVRVVISLSNGNDEILVMDYNEALDQWEGEVTLSSSKVPTGFYVSYIPIKIYDTGEIDDSDITLFDNAQITLDDGVYSNESEKILAYEDTAVLDDIDKTEVKSMFYMQEDVDFTPDSGYIKTDMGDTTVYMNKDLVILAKGNNCYAATECYIAQDNGKYTLWQRGIGYSDTTQQVSAADLNSKGIQTFSVKKSGGFFEKIGDMLMDQGLSEDQKKIKDDVKTFIKNLEGDVEAAEKAREVSQISQEASQLIADLNNLKQYNNSTINAKATMYITELQIYQLMDSMMGSFGMLRNYIKRSNNLDGFTASDIKKYNEIMNKLFINSKYSLSEKEQELVTSMEEAARRSYMSDFEALIKKIKDDKSLWDAIKQLEKDAKDGNLSNKQKIANTKTSVDPSGYVYETFSDNPLKGVTATIYFENDDGYMEVWDAEEYNQVNPQITGDDGSYAWDVPEGLWQVVYSKDGYETVVSEKMEVPPPRLDVNIAMVSNKPAVISKVSNTENAFTVTFDKYVQVDSITRDCFTVSCDSEKMDFELKIPKTSIREYNGKSVVKSVELVRKEGNLKNASYVITARAGMVTYAGVSMKDSSADYVINTKQEAEAYSITIPEGVNVYRNNVLLTSENKIYQNDILYIEAVCPEGKRLKTLQLNGKNIETEFYYTVGEDDVYIAAEFEENIPAAVTLKDTAAVLEVGDKLQLSVKENLAGDKLGWKSSDSSAVSVDENGKVTALRSGSAVITVYLKADPQVSASCSITVKRKAAEISGTASYTKVWGSKVFKLDAAVSRGDGKLSWKSRNTAVASVNSSGVVTLTGVGETVITVTMVQTDIYQAAVKTITVKVTPKSIKNMTAALSASSYTYDGNAKKPSVTLKDGSSVLKSGTAYTVSYSNNTAIGTAKAIIKGKGNYTGSLELKFKILPGKPAVSSVSNTSSGITVKWGKVNGAQGYYVYRKAGSETVWTKIATIKSGTTVSCTDSKASVGGKKYTYSLQAYKTVSGVTYSSSYGSSKTIYRLSQPAVSVSNVSGGIAVKWGKISGASGYYVYRKAGSETKWTKIAAIKSGTTVSYTDKKAVNGNKYVYTVQAYKTVSGITYLSSYISGKTIYCMSSPSITGLTNSVSKTLKVTWSKNTKASGYEIQYAASGSFSKAKSITSAGYKTVTTNVKGLTKGQTCYVRVRSFKTVGNAKYYSAWSTAKKVKISK